MVKAFFAFVLLSISALIFSQEIVSTRLLGMGYGSAYLIEDFDTDILKYPILTNNISKRYGKIFLNPLNLRYNNLSYFVKKNKTIYGINFGYINRIPMYSDPQRKNSFIQVFFGSKDNVFVYKLSNLEISDHLTESFENENDFNEYFKNADHKSTKKKLKHLLTYSTKKEHIGEKELLLSVTIGYNINKIDFDYNIDKSYDTHYDSLETYHHTTYYNNFDNVIYYEFGISERGIYKGPELSLKFSFKLEEMFLNRFPTNMIGEFSWKHFDAKKISGNYIINEYVEYLDHDMFFEPDSIVTYSNYKIYDINEKKSDELILVIGSGTLYQLSERLKFYITGKSLFSYEIIAKTFRSELYEETLKENSTFFNYVGSTILGWEYYIFNNFIIRSGSYWRFKGSNYEYINYKYYGKNKFTPELTLDILAGFSYSYSKNLNFDLAFNLSKEKEELLISTIYEF